MCLFVLINKTKTKIRVRVGLVEEIFCCSQYTPTSEDPQTTTNYSKDVGETLIYRLDYNAEWRMKKKARRILEEKTSEERRKRKEKATEKKNT